MCGRNFTLKASFSSALMIWCCSIAFFPLLVCFFSLTSMIISEKKFILLLCWCGCCYIAIAFLNSLDWFGGDSQCAHHHHANFRRECDKMNWFFVLLHNFTVYHFTWKNWVYQQLHRRTFLLPFLHLFLKNTYICVSLPLFSSFSVVPRSYHPLTNQMLFAFIHHT